MYSNINTHVSSINPHKSFTFSGERKSTMGNTQKKYCINQNKSSRPHLSVPGKYTKVINTGENVLYIKTISEQLKHDETGVKYSWTEDSSICAQNFVGNRTHSKVPNTSNHCSRLKEDKFQWTKNLPNKTSERVDNQPDKWEKTLKNLHSHTSPKTCEDLDVFDLKESKRHYQSELNIATGLSEYDKCHSENYTERNTSTVSKRESVASDYLRNLNRSCGSLPGNSRVMIKCRKRKTLSRIKTKATLPQYKSEPCLVLNEYQEYDYTTSFSAEQKVKTKSERRVDDKDFYFTYSDTESDDGWCTDSSDLSIG